MNGQNLHIVFVTNNYTPYSGGVVSSINAIVPELMRIGHQVSIVTLDFPDSPSHDPAYVYRISCPVKFYYRNNPMAVPWRIYKQVEQLIVQLKPDIIHAHHPWLLGNTAREVARKYHIPIVFTYHTLYEEYAHYFPITKTIARPIIRYLVKNYCKQVDGIIAPSNAVHDQLIAWNIKKPVEILPSPIASVFLQKTRYIPKENTQRAFRLLLVSRLVPEKNIPFLLDMFVQLQKKLSEQITFTMVGYGAQEQFLKDYAYNTLKLSPENLIFLHKKGPEDLKEVYQQADLFLFSSLTDTQGLVLAESMSCATPVIALDGPGQRDIVRNGVNGFLVTSQEEMINIIQKIFNNPTLLMHLRNGALMTAQNYSGETIVKRLDTFYKKFVTPPGNAAKLIS